MNKIFADEHLQTLPQDELIQVQLNKLRRVLGPVLETNGFYRNKLMEAGVGSPQDIGSLDDYYKLPFTLKQELTADQANFPPYGSNMTFDRDSYSRLHQTSGTTGTPLMLLDTEESWDWWGDCWTTVYRAAGVTGNDRIFFAFSFGPFIGFWSAHMGAYKLGALAIPGGGMSSVQRLKAILAHEATVLICTPTYALHLAEVAQQEGIDIENSHVRTLIQAGEAGAGLPSTRARIESVWGASCYDHAGATEVGAWGFEVTGSNGLHVNEGQFLFEVLNPDTGEQADEGELVISNLGRVGMPVLRYRTGDHVKLMQGPLTGAFKFRRLDGGVIGRVDDVMVVRGINVYPSAIENLLRKFPQVGEFAVDVSRENELDAIAIRIEVSDAGDPEETAKLVQKEIHNALALRPNIELVPFGTLPRFELKARRFIDHRKR